MCRGRKHIPSGLIIMIVSVNLQSNLRRFISILGVTANSILFLPSQRNAILMSNAGIAFMVFVVMYATKHFGFATVLKYYGIPWLFVSHWCRSLSALSDIRSSTEA